MVGMGGGADDVGGTHGILNGVDGLRGDARFDELVGQCRGLAVIAPGNLHDLDTVESGQRSGV